MARHKKYTDDLDDLDDLKNSDQWFDPEDNEDSEDTDEGNAYYTIDEDSDCGMSMSMEGQTPYEATRQVLSLSTFANWIQRAIQYNNMQAWVVAEVSQVHKNRHIYLDLVEKIPNTDKNAAQLRCNIWEGLEREALGYFYQQTGGPLQVGMKIMAYIKVTYHPLYGLSGNILMVDPSYTLGDMEARRQAVIEQLKRDGIFDMNKQLELPRIIKRIAIISSETAAGYGDFMNQLTHNEFGLTFSTELFAASVQGDKAEPSVVNALNMIADRWEEFDVVVIIRGGGSKLDLACFDSYNIAQCVAQFPLPVLTGIGHERDQSITDMVAHTRLKTPTAVAEFIVGHNADFLVLLDELQSRLDKAAREIVHSKQVQLENLMLRAVGAVRNHLTRANMQADQLLMRCTNGIRQRVTQAKMEVANAESRLMSAARQEIRLSQNELNVLEGRLMTSASQQLRNERNRLTNCEMRIAATDPRAVLMRGFTLTTDADGKRIANAADVTSGNEITTHTACGKIVSVVK